MTNKRTYRVKALRSGEWWALESPDVRGAFSQVRDLADAAAMMREAISLMLDVPEDEVDARLVEVEEHDPDAEL